MKLTALDIHHKEFRRSLRGYSEEDVDEFLDQVADEFDRLFKENIDYTEKLEQANERVRSYQSMEATLNNTLLSAQRSAEEIVNKAGLEADSMLRDAELKAKEIIHNALQKKQTVANELVRIKHAEEEFRARYKSLLEGQLRDVSEIALPDDVDVLLDDSDGLIGTIDVRPSTQQLVASASAFPPSAAAAPVPAESAPTAGAPESEVAPPVFDYASEAESFAMVGTAPADGSDTTAESAAETGVIEPPASGFVSSVSLGEVGAPDLPDGPVELTEPGEFELPGFEVLGEREIDTDIEEID
jgi:cell division initiation protein